MIPLHNHHFKLFIKQEISYHIYFTRSFLKSYFKLFLSYIYINKKVEMFFQNNSTLTNPNIVHVKLQAVAELVGTFILVFAATAGAILDQKYDGIQTLLGSAACSGVAVMIIVYSIGHISKAHLNPAVTIAYAALGHFPWAQVPIFLVAEIVGSISASFLVKAAYHPFMFGGVTIPSVSVGQAFLLEFVATFFLMFVIIPVATDATAVSNVE